MLPCFLSAFFFLGTLGAAQHSAAASPAVLAQGHVIDRIVAHVEDDILFQSELVELGKFQQFQGNPKESDAQLLDHLILQWIVNSEANSARFAQPGDADLAQAVAALQKQFGSPQAFANRRQNSGLMETQLRRLLKQQIFLTRYLDYKFRAAVQISPAEIEKYYRQSLAPQLAARRQNLPPLPDVEEEIRELLVQREINLRADTWLEESKAQLRIERNINLK